MGGYGPATTGFSLALKKIGDRLEAKFGDQVDVRYVYNILDLGYRAEDILWLVESGVITLGYQSSSYLTDRIPALGVVDLPFLFSDQAKARAAMDGALGHALTTRIEAEDGLPDRRLLRERLPARVEPRETDPHTCGHEGDEHPGAAEQDPGAHVSAARR